MIKMNCNWADVINGITEDRIKTADTAVTVTVVS